MEFLRSFLQPSFHGDTKGGDAKCRLFSQAAEIVDLLQVDLLASEARLFSKAAKQPTERRSREGFCAILNPAKDFFESLLK